jgi:hypothetical protein
MQRDKIRRRITWTSEVAAGGCLSLQTIRNGFHGLLRMFITIYVDVAS